MSPETLFKGAIRIYTQGTPCTPEIAVDIARRMARSVEAFYEAHAEGAPGFQTALAAARGAAHGVADQEETD